MCETACCTSTTNDRSSGGMHFGRIRNQVPAGPPFPPNPLELLCVSSFESGGFSLSRTNDSQPLWGWLQEPCILFVQEWCLALFGTPVVCCLFPAPTVGGVNMGFPRDCYQVAPEEITDSGCPCYQGGDRGAKKQPFFSLV